ncbi:MAG: VanW family protein [Bacteroidota bacterium]
MEIPQHPAVPKPLQRSRLRRRLGKEYYILKRRFQWYFSGTHFARSQQEAALPEYLFGHRTPLLRKLKNVDMWMQHNKIKNLSIAIQTMNGLLVRPGETFSYWRRIGKPTAGKGYVPGMQLDQGKFRSAVGGGLCQLSNLIFWMSMHTPLTIVERWRHSYDVFPDVKRTQPFGSGATCAYNYIDLQLRNDTENTFQLNLWLDKTYLNGEWRAEIPVPYRYEVFESDHLFRQEFWGYTRHNRIARRIIDLKTGEEIGEEPLVENHAVMMYNPMLPG